MRIGEAITNPNSAKPAVAKLPESNQRERRRRTVRERLHDPNFLAELVAVSAQLSGQAQANFLAVLEILRDP